MATIRSLNEPTLSCGCLCLQILSPWLTRFPSFRVTKRHSSPNRHSETSSSASVCANLHELPCRHGVLLITDLHNRVLRSLFPSNSLSERVLNAFVRTSALAISSSSCFVVHRCSDLFLFFLDVGVSTGTPTGVS